MITLEEFFWKATSSYEKELDDHGIFKRYLQAIGGASDTLTLTPINEYKSKVLDPSTAGPEYLYYAILSLGLQGVSEKLAGTRNLLRFWQPLVGLKGTAQFLKVAFSYYGVLIESITYQDRYPRMDGGTPFEIGVPLDMNGPNRQKYVSLVLTGPDVTNALISTLKALIFYNQTPYVNISEITYNGGLSLIGFISSDIIGVSLPYESVLGLAGELILTISDSLVTLSLVEGVLFISTDTDSNIDLTLFRLDNGYLIYGND